MKTKVCISVYFMVAFLFITVFSSYASGRLYYVNNDSGNDSNCGSLEKPLASLCAVNKLRLKAGDHIYFAGNQQFPGSFRISHFKGDKDHPLCVSSYGEGIAVINADSSSSIVIDSSSYVQIKNLRVLGSGRKAGNNGSGIDIKNSFFVGVEGVEASGFLWNGVGVYGGGEISLTGVYAHDNGSNGIGVSGPWGNKIVRNIYIGYCVAENNPGNPRILDNHSGNGILVGNATSVLIEYCEAMNNGWDMPRSGNGPVGIWAYESDSLTIQYCYAHDNKTSPKGKDGGGFDFDGGITHSMMQYNLSMNNEGAGYGLFQFAGASDWSDNTIRYNVSINDGCKNSQAGFFVWCDPLSEKSPMKRTDVYKNTVINQYDHAVHFETGFCRELLFRENMFYLSGNNPEPISGDKTSDLATFRGNTYWSEKHSLESILNKDKEAIFKKYDFVLPSQIEINRIEEIVKSLLK